MVFIHKFKQNDVKTNGSLPSIQYAFGIVPIGIAPPSIYQAWPSTSQGLPESAQMMPLVQSNMFHSGGVFRASPGFHMGLPIGQPLAALQPFDQASLTGRQRMQPTEVPMHMPSVQVEPVVQILESEQHMCDQCGKTFALKRNLIRHVKTHLEEKEFSYETCNKNFSWTEHLERQRKIPEKVFPTPLVPAEVPKVIVPNPVATTPVDLSTSNQSSPWNENRRITCYSDIPESIFFKICKYLNFQEVLSLGSVCRRWYLLSRSSVLWERTDLISLNLPPEKSESLLMNLPSTVRELRIGKCSSSNIKQTLNAPAVYNKLFELFSDLNILIIENALLAKPGCQLYLHNGYMLNCKVPMSDQVSKHYSVMQYHSLLADADFCTLISKLENIQILSLRSSILALPGNSSFGHIRNTPSMLRILDLTLCPCATDKTIQTFCQLPFLEELYVAGTAITVNGVSIILQEVPRLKVLDLDDTVVGGETFKELKLRGKSLVELYLGKTAVKDSSIIDLNKETFPVLEKLCLKRTAVSEIGILKLLVWVTSLTHIFLTKSQVKTMGWDQPAFERKEIKYDDYDENEECNHFLNNKFQGKFSKQRFLS